MARNSRLSKSRSSKSRPPRMGRKWTQDDLLAYKIKVVYEDLETFFGLTELPPPVVEEDPHAAQGIATVTDLWTSDLLSSQCTNGVTGPDYRESGTIAFVRELFIRLRYSYVSRDLKIRRSAMIKHPLRYLAKASPGKSPDVDICIMDDTYAILLVAKVDTHLRGSDPEPRLISEAVAAFHNDNIMHAKIGDADPLTSKIVPGIVMDGTMPTFYNIPITPELVTAVESGEPPKQDTIVHAYRPQLPTPGEGMGPLNNRSIILSYLEAFRQFL